LPTGPLPPAATRPPARQKVLFVAGVLVLWAASDWPLGALGAGYLASAHMTQFVLYSVVATPLIMLGLPEPMFAAMLAKLRLTSVFRILALPLVAALVFNITMVATHAPPTTDLLRSSQIGSFVMDILWIVAAVVLWLPVISPVRSLRMRSYPGMMGGTCSSLSASW
jgi:cytochrome c oxidase assembly factor CtaG